MSRKLFLRLALVMLIVAAVHRETLGTVVLPAWVECPVCGESFVVARLASYSSFGEPARDLSDSSFARFGKVRVCPHCLYATLDSEFAALPADQKNALQALLEKPRLQLCHEEIQALAAAEDDLRLMELIVSARLARQCYTSCGTADSHELSLRLLLFYRTVRCEDLHTYYRRQTIEQMRQQLNAGRDSPREQAVNTYLLGELLRQDQQADAALREFARATVLAERYNKPFKDDDRRSLHWIVSWSAEQSLRVRLARKTAEQLRPLLSSTQPPEELPTIDRRKLAIETLAERGDRESWRVLTDFAMKDPRNLEYLLNQTRPTKEKLHIDSRMWPHLKQQYARAADPTGRDDDPFGRRQGLSGTLHEILYKEDWGDRGSDRDAAALMKTLPLAPRDWSEGRILASLHRCIQTGHRPAVDHFFRSCRKLDSRSLDDNLLRIVACLTALAAQPELWSVPAELASSDIPEPRHLAVCLKYLRGDDAARQQLVSCIGRDRSCQGMLALECLQLRNDSAAIEVLAARPHEEDDDVDDFFFTMCTDEYLKHVATPAHLDAIKQRSSQQPIFKSIKTEEIVRTIRLRELLRRSLPANTPRKSRQKTEVPRNDRNK